MIFKARNLFAILSHCFPLLSKWNKKKIQKIGQKISFLKMNCYKTQQSAGFPTAKCGVCPIKIRPQSAKTQSAGEQSAGFMCTLINSKTTIQLSLFKV